MHFGRIFVKETTIYEKNLFGPNVSFLKVKSAQLLRNVSTQLMMQNVQYGFLFVLVVRRLGPRVR
eukprot:UN02772